MITFVLPVLRVVPCRLYRCIVQSSVCACIVQCIVHAVQITVEIDLNMSIV